MDAVEAVLDGLRQEGLTFDRLGEGDDYGPGAGARARFVHRPVLTLPPAELEEFVRQLGEPDHTSGVEMAALHVVETLTTDHGDGRNATTAVGFRFVPGGRVEFYADVDRPDLPPPGSELLGWGADRPS
ncbi:hypothetical protein [Pseudonocardia sp.]|uniref:hypothetical protein n=1 Tax=Pseudonocardia sp. TaxID=60912 RepID=UPI00260442BA|nr:hypothetical protein [Pseudonocardia sp.]